MTKRPWIAVERHVTKRDVAFRAAEALDISRWQAVGHLVAFWGEVSEDARGGDLSRTSDEQIEAWGGWTEYGGELGVFARFVRANCVTDDMVKGWHEMQGPLEERRAHDRERMKAWREKSKPSRDRHVTSRGTQHNTTQQVTTTTTRAGKAADPLVAEVLTHYTAVHPKRRPGKKAEGAVVRALKTYPASDLMAAIDGNARDPWHREKGKHELDYVLRDNEKIDSFRLRPKPVLLYDPEIHGPEVDDTGVINPRLDWLTDPNHPERWQAQEAAQLARKVGA